MKYSKQESLDILWGIKMKEDKEGGGTEAGGRIRRHQRKTAGVWLLPESDTHTELPGERNTELVRTGFIGAFCSPWPEKHHHTRSETHFFKLNARRLPSFARSSGGRNKDTRKGVEGKKQEFANWKKGTKGLYIALEPSWLSEMAWKYFSSSQGQNCSNSPNAKERSSNASLIISFITEQPWHWQCHLISVVAQGSSRG